jgi:hypothetical protein
MDRRQRTKQLSRPAAAWAAAFALCAACTMNPYVIGEYIESPDASTSPDGNTPLSTATFAAGLSNSGPSALPSALDLPLGATPATLRLRGEAATTTGWPADTGSNLMRGSGSPIVHLGTPFSDATGMAVGLASDGSSYAAATPDVGAIDADDAVFEVVLRAVPGATLLDKRGTSSGWALRTNAAGSLGLELDDGQLLVTVPSEPLVSEAWYHCLFWVTHGANGDAPFGRADCDGRQGTSMPLGALGSLASTTDLSVGGNVPGSGALTELAYFSLFRAPPGSLDGVDWLTIGRARFAALTGSLPQVHGGSLLPAAGARASVAYLDIDHADGAGRHLFLVGPDWPRVACRTDSTGHGGCGYLSEQGGPRLLSPDPMAWTADEITLVPNHALFADGDTRMGALVPSTQSAAHVLTASGSYGPAQQAFSFFVRAESGRYVGASVSNHGEAVFDLQAGVVVTQPAGAGARATLEPWGAGLFRCAYVFTAEAGALVYRVHLLDDAPSDVFAGNGATAWADVTGMQLDVSSAFPASLLGAAVQAPDSLTFVASDGNLPNTAAVSVQFNVLLPAGPRLTDQAIVNLNLGDATEQANDQVNLFVTGSAAQPTGELGFWALQNGATYWTVDYPVSAPHPSIVDGAWHDVQAEWAPSAVGMSVDGVAASWAPQKVSATPFAFDRIDIGFSLSSSGYLVGLVGALQIGPP